MEHVVFFPAPDGAPAFRRVHTLEDALHLVEQLRNSGVAEVTVHALTPVPLAFRQYIRVELADGSVASAPDDPGLADLAPATAAPVDAAPVDAAPVDAAPVDAAPVDEAASADAGAELVPDPAPEPVRDAVPDAAPTADILPSLTASEPLVSVGDPGQANGKRGLGFFAR